MKLISRWTWGESKRAHADSLGGPYPNRPYATSCSELQREARGTQTRKAAACHPVSVRGWTRSVIGLEFHRYETVWSPAVTHEYGLVRPELGEISSRCQVALHLMTANKGENHEGADGYHIPRPTG
jgi:hypothetical protein